MGTQDALVRLSSTGEPLSSRNWSRVSPLGRTTMPLGRSTSTSARFGHGSRSGFLPRSCLACRVDDRLPPPAAVLLR